jgi:fructosamine-3-kinase
VDCHLAELLLGLRLHASETYGLLGTAGHERWADWFCHVMASSLRDAAPRLSPATRDAARAILMHVPRALADAGPPTHVHGDVWENSILVAPGPVGWRVTGILDPGALYADVEFELAYMEVFGTVSDAFRRRYCETRPLRPGYELRRLSYGLHTMLVHVAVFGDAHDVERTGRIADELERAWGL